MKIRRFPKETIPDPPGGATANVATAAIVEGPDGVERRLPNPPGPHIMGADSRVTGGDSKIDSGSALQIGMYRLLFGLTAHRLDLQDMIDKKVVKSDAFRFVKIMFDWPRQEDEIEFPSALITFPDDQVFKYQHFNSVVLDDTLDVFGEGTVLKRTSTLSTPMLVVVWSDHKEERRGIRAAMEDALMDEALDELIGRRVSIPEYYDRTARFTFRNIAYSDGDESAQRNQWILVATFDAEIDVVKLITTPGFLRPQFPHPNVGSDVEP